LPPVVRVVVVVVVRVGVVDKVHHVKGVGPEGRPLLRRHAAQHPQRHVRVVLAVKEPLLVEQVAVGVPPLMVQDFAVGRLQRPATGHPLPPFCRGSLGIGSAPPTPPPVPPRPLASCAAASSSGVRQPPSHLRSVSSCTPAAAANCACVMPRA